MRGTRVERGRSFRGIPEADLRNGAGLPQPLLPRGEKEQCKMQRRATPCNRTQRHATLLPSCKTNPPRCVTSGSASSTVDTALRPLTQVDLGLQNALPQNEPIRAARGRSYGRRDGIDGRRYNGPASSVPTSGEQLMPKNRDDRRRQRRVLQDAHPGHPRHARLAGFRVRPDVADQRNSVGGGVRRADDRDNKFPAKVSATTDRRQAIADATSSS